MRRLLFSLLAVGPAGITPHNVSRLGTDPGWKVAEQTLILDVSYDGRSFALNPADPAAKNPLWGDWFFIGGKIFPGGTIPKGDGVFNPLMPGSIGDWSCRGVFLGPEGPFMVDEIYQLKDGRALMSSGLVGADVPRAVTGGTGSFSGASGEVIEETLGTNTTQDLDIRLTFKLK